MSRSRLFYSTALLLAGFGLGCHSSTPPTSTPAQVSPAQSSEGTIPAPSPARQDPAGPQHPDDPAVAPGTAQALAQRAQMYADSMAPAHSNAAGSSKLLHPQWPDPDALRLTPQAESDATQQPHAPPSAAHPEANASISVPTAQQLVKPDKVSTPPVEAPMTDTMASQFAKRSQDYPADLSAQFDNQVFKFMHEDAVPDLATLSGLAPEDRELLSALMDSLTNFRSQLRADNNMLFSKKIRPLVELSDRLRSQAELSVPTVALCTKVTAFGVYEPIDPARFIAGHEQRVVVYCEVENFLAQPNAKDQYETRLTQDIVLYTESSGLPVWSDKQSSYVDLARRRRHDFFIGKIITLPANLTLGRYILKVTVEDQQARHVAENAVPIEIVAQ